MPPIAATPVTAVDTVSDLTTHGIENGLKQSVPSQLKSATLIDTITDLPSVPLISVDAAATPLTQLNASLLEYTYTTTPRAVPAAGSKEQASQKVCTDHMIQARWTLDAGWEAPKLQPYGPLSLMPTASCLQYATECFEGMKLYRGHDGRLRLFRPQLNCNRMLMSTTRIALPGFPPSELLNLIARLCAVDGKKWLPQDQPGSFLYIRPCMIATDPALGVQRPTEALLLVMLACFPSMDNARGGLRLLASQDDMCRAWPGGFGYAKVGANYGPSLVAQGEARKRGFHQILWLFGADDVVTEAGASNFFIVWRASEVQGGQLQLVTAALDEKIVLDGVTRRSVLELVRSRLDVASAHAAGLEPLEVVERRFTMGEVVAALKEGRLVEAFAAGTAWFVSPVAHIHFRGQEFDIPMKDGVAGAYTGFVKEALRGIMWGAKGWEEHEWGFVVDED